MDHTKNHITPTVSFAAPAHVRARCSESDVPLAPIAARIVDAATRRQVQRAVEWYVSTRVAEIKMIRALVARTRTRTRKAAHHVMALAAVSAIWLALGALAASML